MDRTLKVYTKTNHLFAEFTFNYDRANEVNANYTLYRRRNDDDEDDESKSVYPLHSRTVYLQFRRFSSIEEIKAADIETVKKELRHDMTDPRGYNYVYETEPVRLRYVAQNHRGCIGMIDILFSFIENTKAVKFLSGTHPRFDFDLESNSLESNADCILRIPVYTDSGIAQIDLYDLKRLPPWY